MDEIETAANLIVATSAISRPADKLLSLRSTSLAQPSVLQIVSK